MLKAIHLRTEGLRNPVGISFHSPKLSWKLEGEEHRRNQRQIAYQILCAKAPEKLTEESCLWNSKKVVSDSTNGITCPICLSSRQRIYWKVRIWDECDEPGAYSDDAFFEMGLLAPSDWSAEWINPEEAIDPNERQSASYLTKTFTLSETPKAARLYMTACGMYRAMVNGLAVDEQILAPGTTQYNKRLQVQTYDLTGRLHQGENTIRVVVGDGWFRGMNGMQRRRNVYGDYIALLGQLECVMPDGRKEVIVTDESWQAAQDGSIRCTDFMQGEYFDANRRPSKYHPVKRMDLGYRHLTGTNSVPVKEQECFQAKLLYTGEQETVLDFGQNMSGYVSFILRGSAATKGQTVVLEHGEALDRDGRFTMENLEGGFDPKTPPLLQKVTYIASEEKEQHYKPSFSTFGFRYVRITGWPGKVDPSDFKAYAVYSDITVSAEFTCSNPLVNQLVKNTVWSQKSNFVDVPTDCPQRERAGYTGDAQVFVQTGSILMDSLPFYRKWLADLRATQDASGKISNIAPMQQKSFEYFDGSAGWGDAIVIVPYILYRQYGDKEVLCENYNAMKAWADYELREAQKNHMLHTLRWGKWERYIWDTGRHWGEWLEPGQTMSYLLKRMYLGCPETATAYMYYSCWLFAKIARVLNRTEAKAYEETAKKIRRAYEACFFRENISSKRQCLSVRPVFMGLARGEAARKLAAHLNNLVVSNAYHLNTGFLSTPHICRVLTEYGYEDTAFRLLEQESMPGWLYPVTKGATTIWEKWDSIKEDGSLDSSQNHYSYGAIVGWLFDTVAGIKPIKAGYKTFRIAPHLGGSFTWAKCEMDTSAGVIKTNWERKEDRVLLNVDVPVNTMAYVLIPVSKRECILSGPDGIEYEPTEKGLSCEMGSGSYQFEYKSYTREPKELELKSGYFKQYSKSFGR